MCLPITPYRLMVLLNSNFDKYYSLSAAIQIPSGADLNNYTDFGNYVSSAASISSTLQNCPASKGGFVLHVERVTGATNGAFLKQRIVYNEAKSLEYWRVRTGEESWGTWVSPITNADLISSYYKGDEVTINASGTTDIITKNISSIIPSGCKIFTAFARAVNNAGGVINYVTYTENTISYRIRNLTNAPITVIPYIGLIFAK